MKLVDFIRYKILHMHPPMPKLEWPEVESRVRDMSGVSARSLGKESAKQMQELNRTINMLKNKVKRKLPDYLKENLEEITIGGEINNISLQYHFKNYNKMNKSLVNDIRSDFASCIQTDKLPDYKIKFSDTHFILIFYLEDYI